MTLRGGASPPLPPPLAHVWTQGNRVSYVGNGKGELTEAINFLCSPDVEKEE